MKRIAALALVVLVLGGGLALWSRREPPPVQVLGPVTVGASTAVTGALVWLAQERGLFQESGIQVVLKGYSFGKAATDALGKGEVDLCTTAEFVVAKMAAAQPDLRILGTVAVSHDIDVVAAPDRGIAGPADLAGKRIALTQGSNAEFFLSRLLALKGMPADAVQRINLTPPKMAEALARGEADAVIVWQPYARAAAARLGDRAVVFDGQPDQDYYFVLAGRAGWLAEKGTETKRVMAALKKAEAWAADHPEAFLEFIRTRMASGNEIPEHARKDHHFMVSLPASLVTALTEEVRWLAKTGLVPRESRNDILDFFEAGPLREVAPTAVTMVR